MKPFPKIGVVVLNYGGGDVLKKCLAGLFCLDYPNFEVVVVDNNSADGSLENARQNFSRATFIKNENNIGFSAGGNIGIKHSLEKMAEFVLLLNINVKPDRDCLAKLMEVAEEKPEAGLFSPIIFSGNSDKVLFSGGKISWLTMKSARTISKKTDFISDDAMFIRAEVFKKVGLLDEDFFLSWADRDFSVRAKKAGFSLMIAADAVARRFEKSEKQTSHKIYWQTLSELMFFQKNAPRCLKFWIAWNIFLRKIKNQDAMRKNKTEINLAVGKAFEDFEKMGNEKGF